MALVSNLGFGLGVVLGAAASVLAAHRCSIQLNAYNIKGLPKKVLCATLHLFVALAALKMHGILSQSEFSFFAKRLLQGSLLVPLVGVGALLEQRAADLAPRMLASQMTKTMMISTFFVGLYALQLPLVATVGAIGIAKQLYVTNQSKYRICIFSSNLGRSIENLARLIRQLPQEEFEIEVYAMESALKKIQKYNFSVIRFFSTESLSQAGKKSLAEELAEECLNASIAITDAEDPFAETMQKALARITPSTYRLAYSDRYIAGRNSTVASRIVQAAQGVLLLNSGPPFEGRVNFSDLPLLCTVLPK